MDYRSLVQQIVSKWNEILKYSSYDPAKVLKLEEHTRNGEFTVFLREDRVFLFRVGIRVREDNFSEETIQSAYARLLTDIVMAGINVESTRWKNGFYERKGDDTIIINQDKDEHTRKY